MRFAPRDAATRFDADAPPLREVVLVAQDLASYGRDRTGPGRAGRIAHGPSPIAALTRAVAARVERTRLLYLYPSGLTDELIETRARDRACPTSTSPSSTCRAHSSHACAAGATASGSCAASRTSAPPSRDATFRSSFILGYPGETEHDHDLLLEFLEAAQLDWAGFFPFSHEEGTHAAGLPDQVPPELALERLRECSELQDAITAAKRDALVGECRTVLVDAPGEGRTVHEAPEIDGIVHVPATLQVGSLVDVHIVGAEGPDLSRRAHVGALAARQRRGTGTVSDATHEHPSPPRLHVRAQRAGHPGQRRHRGPAPGGARLRPDARRVGRVLGQRRRRLPPRRQRRARRLHGPPPRHDPLGRLPRSRWPTRPSSSAR